MTETTAQIIWNKLVVPNLKIIRNEEQEVIGFVCEEFFKMTDDEYNTFIEAEVRMEEE